MMHPKQQQSEAIRVLYVEDDPVLRSLFVDFLGDADGVEVVATASNADEAIELVQGEQGAEIDVALLDLALGARSINGVELGLRLRRIKPSIGVAIISQHLVPKLLSSLPEEERHGWAYIQKRGDLAPSELGRVVRGVADGFVMIDPAAFGGRDVDLSELAKLSLRQRDILALLATGRDAVGISEDLNIPYASVRRDLSNAYRVLVPGTGKGYDLRVVSLLVYQRVTRPYDFDDVTAATD